uniref:Uncharacterized protein n=1 Tax=Romanomermis culicivorax TaxID=13658 RepID=A0A915IQ39_ROMCU
MCLHANFTPRVNPNLFYLFKKKKVERLAIDGEVIYFECVSCNSHGNPMGHITVRVKSGSRSQSNLGALPDPKLKLLYLYYEVVLADFIASVTRKKQQTSNTTGIANQKFRSLFLFNKPLNHLKKQKM